MQVIFATSAQTWRLNNLKAIGERWGQEMKRPPAPDLKKLAAAEAKLFPPEICKQLHERRLQNMQKITKTPILPANIAAYLLWCEVAGIWVVGGFGGILGIAWERAESLLRLKQYVVTPAAMRGCRIIESACMAEYHKDTKK